MQIENNVILEKFTSFRVGGGAKYFAAVKNQHELLEAIDFAKRQQIKYFILGSGTNLLVSDQGYDGLVILNQLKALEFNSGLVISETANTLPVINQFGNKNGLVGFEKLATVPGTLGGALYNNAHWMDDLISNYVRWIEVIDPAVSELTIKRISGPELDFSYDNSAIKKRGLIAVRAALFLPVGDVAASRIKLIEYTKKRNLSQPYGTKNSGCVFQNVPQSIGPGNHGTSAGYLIDQAGLKGTRIGNAQISLKHGNFFINLGNASSNDIIKLAELCRQKVFEKFGVTLEYEIKII